MRGIASWALCLLLSFAFCTVALAAQDATLTLQMSYSTGTAGSKSTPISGVTANIRASKMASNFLFIYSLRESEGAGPQDLRIWHQPHGRMMPRIALTHVSAVWLRAGTIFL